MSKMLRETHHCNRHVSDVWQEAVTSVQVGQADRCYSRSPQCDKWMIDDWYGRLVSSIRKAGPG